MGTGIDAPFFLPPFAVRQITPAAAFWQGTIGFVGLLIVLGCLMALPRKTAQGERVQAGKHRHFALVSQGPSAS